MDCCRVGCYNKAEFQVIVLLKAPGDYGYPPMRMIISNFGVCAKHKDDVKLESVVNDQGWERIFQLFRDMGAVEPEKALCHIAFEELQELEV